LSLIVVTNGGATNAGKGVLAVHLRFVMTLAMEIYTFMTLKLEECVGGKLQTLHMLQFLCCILCCMICVYRALLNIMLKRNIPDVLPAQVLSSSSYGNTM
jgi:hypothetical protein